MNIKLIEGWTKAYKMLSVQGNIIGGTIASTYVMMYDQLKEHVAPTTMGKIVVGMFVLNILLRLIDQGIASKGSSDAPDA